MVPNNFVDAFLIDKHNLEEIAEFTHFLKLTQRLALPFFVFNFQFSQLLLQLSMLFTIQSSFSSPKLLPIFSSDFLLEFASVQFFSARFLPFFHVQFNVFISYQNCWCFSFFRVGLLLFLFFFLVVDPAKIWYPEREVLLRMEEGHFCRV